MACGCTPLLEGAEETERMLALLRELVPGHAIMLVEQNVAQSLDVADEAHVLENGAFALGGTAADVRADPHLQRAYLGL